MPYTANKKPSGLDAAASVAGSDVLVLEKSGTVQKATADQVTTYAFSSKGTTIASPSGSEVAVVRDGAVLKDIQLSNIVPDGTVTNAKVSSVVGNRIDGNKITPNFGSQTVQTTGQVSAGSLAVSGNSTMSGTLLVTGALTANGGINATITGTSSSANQLTTARSIAATGDISWSVNFNGSADVTAAATIQANQVTDAKLRTSSACSVVGRSANSTGNVADIAAGSDDLVLRRAAGALGFGTLPTGSIADNAVTGAKLRDSAALSVVGNGTNSAADPSDITASVDGYVLRRSGTSLAFGQIVAAGLAADCVETAKIKDGNVTNAKFAGSVGLNAWTTKTSAYTAIAGDRIVADTTSAAFTITLPTTPASYTEVTFADHYDKWATNNLTIARGGSDKINGLSENLVCDQAGGRQIVLRYEGATIGWRIYT